MNKPCARCNKTVYPVEKLSCLDKVWHKGCFTCETCNMKLTMKTYKGYSKLPYCVTHYPTTKFTAVADTPENKRLAKQSANQSNLEYHKDHKADLTKFSQVSSTPALETSKKNQRIASQAEYVNRARSKDEQEAARVNLAGDQGPPQQQGYQPGGYVQAPPPKMPPPQQPPAPPAQSSGPKYVALYDYAAADQDEVSFQEGDFIIDATIIDDGWMEGKVERTGQHGMLPSNYVEPS